MQTLTDMAASPMEPTYLISLLSVHPEASHMRQGVYSRVLGAWVRLTPRIGADRQLGEMLWPSTDPPASDSEGLFPSTCVSCVVFRQGRFFLK